MSPSFGLRCVLIWMINYVSRSLKGRRRVAAGVEFAQNSSLSPLHSNDNTDVE